MPRRLVSRRTFVASSATAVLLGCGDESDVDMSDSTGEIGSTGEEVEGSSTGDDRTDTDVDVVIIGAGLSGLTAARSLERVGYSVRVFEARDDVGGRTKDWDLGDGAVAEGGAQWVGADQTAILQLAEELGIETYPADVPGNVVLHFEGQTFESTLGEPSDEVQALRASLDALAATIPVDAPWDAPDAELLDALTAEDWLLDQNPSPDAAFEMASSIGVWLGDMSQISLLYLAYYVASAGSVQALDEDAQSHRLAGGPARLSQLMAEELGEVVHTSSPVERVEQLETHVRIMAGGETTTAARVIIAMAPSDADRIRFAPPLPQARAELQSTWVSSPGVKLHVLYATPFWRAQGRSGTALSDLPITGLTFDASPPDGSIGVLVLFPNDDALPDTAAEREAAVLDELVTLFGDDAGDSIGYREVLWADEPWIAGCTSPLPPGVLTSVGSALRVPVGRVHWAGTETATQWTGYMDGAVRAGQRAALEVADALAADEAG